MNTKTLYAPTGLSEFIGASGKAYPVTGSTVDIDEPDVLGALAAGFAFGQQTTSNATTLNNHPSSYFAPASTTPVIVAAPTTAADSGTSGQIAFDTGYVYICVATNTWLRAAIATWP